MRYTIVRWIGTLLIIAVGVLYAVNATYKWKISEAKVYNLKLSDYVFALGDGRQVSMTINFMFTDKQSADELSKKKIEIITVLNTFFRGIDSTNFNTADQIDILKSQMLTALRASKFQVQQITFDANPMFL